MKYSQAFQLVKMFVVSSSRYVMNVHKSKALEMYFFTVEAGLSVFVQG